MLKPNLKEMWFFSSPLPVAWKKKNKKQTWQFLTVWILSFHSGSQPRSRIRFLSQTNELQRLHYVASSKQEAGVSDGGGLVLHNEGGLGQPSPPCGVQAGVWESGALRGAAPSHAGVFVQLGQLPPRTRTARLLGLEKGGPHVWQRTHLYLWESTALRGSCQTPSPLIHSPPGLWGEFASGPRVGGPDHRRGAPLTSETTKGKGSLQRVQMWTIRMHRGRLMLTIFPRLRGHPPRKRLGLPFVPVAPTTTKSLPEGHWEVHIWETHHFPASEKRPEQPNLGFTLGSWTWLTPLWKSKPRIGPQRALCCSFMKL